MHHKDTYLRLKQTAIPHLCPAGNTRAPVCVSPGRPGGNTRHSGVHCVSSCFSSLLVLGPEIFFGKSVIFSAKRPMSHFFFWLQNFARKKNNFMQIKMRENSSRCFFVGRALDFSRFYTSSVSQHFHHCTKHLHTRIL